nr:CPBP family intramembrane glutamic endopeptidase [Aestuariimicrobium kwangyangense]
MTGVPVLEVLATNRRRRTLLVETAIVLAISLGQSAVYSVLSIIERLTRAVPLAQQTSQLNTSATPDRPWLDLAYQLANVGFGIVPALLAVHLLASRFVPRGGVAAALGTSPRRVGRDLVWGVGVAAGIGIPGLGLYLGARALGINTTVQAANLGENWWTVPVLVLAAAMNGVLEEVVMIGYLVTRWLQAGWRTWVVVACSALIRGAYHLYQGFGGFVGNLVMGLIFGVFFVKVRRIWPLVIAHTLLDVASFVGYSFLAGRVSWL